MSDEELNAVGRQRLAAAYQDWSNGFRGRGQSWEEFLDAEKARWVAADRYMAEVDGMRRRFEDTGEFEIGFARETTLPSGRRLAPGMYRVRTRAVRQSRPQRKVVGRRASRSRRRRVAAGRSPDDPSGEPPSPESPVARRDEDSDTPRVTIPAGWTPVQVVWHVARQLLDSEPERHWHLAALHERRADHLAFGSHPRSAS